LTHSTSYNPIVDPLFTSLYISVWAGVSVTLGVSISNPAFCTLSGASAKFNALLSASMQYVFARGDGSDAPLPFDCLVSKGEKALLSDGEWDYLVGIGAVPVLSSVAGGERVQHASPMPIDAR